MGHREKVGEDICGSWVMWAHWVGTAHWHLWPGGHQEIAGMISEFEGTAKERVRGGPEVSSSPSFKFLLLCHF